MDPLREYHEGVEKTRLIKWEERVLLGVNARVAMVGRRSTNVGLMFS